MPIGCLVCREVVDFRIRCPHCLVSCYCSAEHLTLDAEVFNHARVCPCDRNPASKRAHEADISFINVLVEHAIPPDSTPHDAFGTKARRALEEIHEAKSAAYIDATIPRVLDMRKMFEEAPAIARAAAAEYARDHPDEAAVSGPEWAERTREFSEKGAAMLREYDLYLDTVGDLDTLLTSKPSVEQVTGLEELRLLKVAQALDAPEWTDNIRRIPSLDDPSVLVSPLDDRYIRLIPGLGEALVIALREMRRVRKTCKTIKTLSGIDVSKMNADDDDDAGDDSDSDSDSDSETEFNVPPGHIQEVVTDARAPRPGTASGFVKSNANDYTGNPTQRRRRPSVLQRPAGPGWCVDWGHFLKDCAVGALGATLHFLKDTWFSSLGDTIILRIVHHLYKYFSFTDVEEKIAHIRLNVAGSQQAQAISDMFAARVKVNRSARLITTFAINCVFRIGYCCLFGYLLSTAVDTIAGRGNEFANFIAGNGNNTIPYYGGATIEDICKKAVALFEKDPALAKQALALHFNGTKLPMPLNVTSGATDGAMAHRMNAIHAVTGAMDAMNQLNQPFLRFFHFNDAGKARIDQASVEMIENTLGAPGSFGKKYAVPDLFSRTLINMFVEGSDAVLLTIARGRIVVNDLYAAAAKATFDPSTILTDNSMSFKTKAYFLWTTQRIWSGLAWQFFMSIFGALTLPPERMAHPWLDRLLDGPRGFSEWLYQHLVQQTPNHFPLMQSTSALSTSEQFHMLTRIESQRDVIVTNIGIGAVSAIIAGLACRAYSEAAFTAGASALAGGVVGYMLDFLSDPFVVQTSIIAAHASKDVALEIFAAQATYASGVHPAHNSWILSGISRLASDGVAYFSESATVPNVITQVCLLSSFLTGSFNDMTKFAASLVARTPTRVSRDYAGDDRNATPGSIAYHERNRTTNLETQAAERVGVGATKKIFLMIAFLGFFVAFFYKFTTVETMEVFTRTLFADK